MHETCGGSGILGVELQNILSRGGGERDTSVRRVGDLGSLGE